MLSRSERAVLDTALQKYRTGRTEPLLVGGINLLKPVLRLMTGYRLVIQEVEGPEVLTSYTKWIESVQLKEGENQEVYVTLSPRVERIWLESKKRLPDYMEQKPANTGLRSQYALRFYSWAKKYAETEPKVFRLRIFGECLGWSQSKIGRKRDSGSALADLGEFPTASTGCRVAQVNAKTDLKIEVVSIERSKHRRVVTLTFAIKNAGGAETAPKSMKTRSDASLPKLHLILSKSPSGQLLSK
jgi:hypothetical protein